MKVVVDKIGRVLIPKKIRDHTGIKPGTELSIQEVQHGIVKLESIDVDNLLVNKGGVLVFQGYKTDDLEGVVNNLRHENIHNMLK